jgi:hypothetical protein
MNCDGTYTLLPILIKNFDYNATSVQQLSNIFRVYSETSNYGSGDTGITKTLCWVFSKKSFVAFADLKLNLTLEKSNKNLVISLAQN